MCGLNGFNFQDAAALHRMHAATKHRGPDDEGFFETSQISLAHNRLSIIDLSPAGRQPMTTPDGRFTVVFNGEIYNYRELRQELEAVGEKFISHSDTEVLLKAFARWGEAMLPRLNGIFALAVWDQSESRLLLARDPLGIKPLYYLEQGNKLIFSSEVKGILAHGVSRGIDPEALNLYFRFLYVPGPRSMFAGIKKLQPGHLLKLRDGKIEIKRWWAWGEGEYLKDKTSATQEVRRLLLQAVKRQLVSDRPLGVFLSGGVDSSSVLAAMRQIQPSGTIKTFSVGYAATAEAEKYNSDAELARRTADFFSTEHHEVTLSGRDAAAVFEDCVWHMDEPVSNHIQPSTFVLARFAKPQITVALGGDGGDELFAGYDRYWLSAFVDRVRAIPAALRPAWLLGLIEQATGRGGLADKVELAQGLGRFFGFIGQKMPEAMDYIRPESRQPAAGDAAFAPYFASLWRDFTNQFLATDIQTWLPDESLIRSDKLTMAHGLEERVPLLDLELVRFAFRLPSRWKLNRRGQGKKIMLDAMRDLLPPHVLAAKKQGFFSPAAKWLRGDMLPFAREVLSDGYCPASAEYLDLNAVRRDLEDHLTKKKYGLNRIWSAMTFQVWFRRFMTPGIE
ncbi:MAG: asparagine synthase (glutamine-hydrolyzing) [Patescibacteria group bacterium]